MASDYSLTFADVQPFLPQFTITDTTTPSDSDVNGFIEKREAVMHRVLAGQSIATPLTDPEDIDAVTEFILQIAAYDTFTRGMQYVNLPEHVQGWREDWNTFLSDIKSGKMTFATDDTPEGDDSPLFGMSRPIPRDPIFSHRFNTTRYDE